MFAKFAPIFANDAKFAAKIDPMQRLMKSIDQYGI